jgi:hypothetical protein
MKADVQRHCKKCDKCIARKHPRKQKAPMKPYVTGSAMERLTTDILGPLERTTAGNKYILVVTDCFTKWTESYAIPNIEAKTVAKKIVEEWVCRYGAPTLLHSDQGGQFEARLFQELCKLLGIIKTRTTALRPQSNGQVERFNRTLAAMLSIYADAKPKSWDKHLPFVMGAYRSAKHESTGLTPNQMVLGHQVRLPVHLVTGNPNETVTSRDEYVEELRKYLQLAFEAARKHLQRDSEIRKKRYDVGTKTTKLKEGEPVWLYNPNKNLGKCAKFTPFWKKGWVITKQIDDINYRIQNGPEQTPRVVHVDRLLPYTGDDPPMWWKQ